MGQSGRFPVYWRKSDATAHQRTFGEFVRGLSGTGLLDTRDPAHPSGSEFHLAIRLVRSGRRVEFLPEHFIDERDAYWPSRLSDGAGE